MDAPVVTREDRLIAGPLQRMGWLLARAPLAPIVWPGMGPSLSPTTGWPEWALIGLTVLAYASWVLDAPLALILQAATYAFHPLFALPALVADAATAMRLALLLSFLGAAAGMWWLGRVLGLGRAGRTWATLGFALAGQAAAAVPTGVPGFALGYAWLPWAAAYAWLAVTTKRPLYVALAGLTAALIALSGHLGLIVSVTPALLFFVLGPVLARGRGRLGVTLPRSALIVGAILLVLAIGLAAVGLLPALALGSTLRAGAASAAGVGAILRAYMDSSGPAASYAYIGVAPFVLAVSLLLAREKWRGRPFATLALLALFSLAWAGSGLGRGAAAPAAMLAWGGLALFALAGAGLDAFWQWGLANWHVQRVYVPDIVRGAAVRGGLAVVALLAVLALTTAYGANQPLLSGAGAPGAAAGTLSGLAVLRGYAAAQPFSFKAGAVVSFISFLGFLSLLITDVRRRRNRIEAEAVYSDGVLRPETELGLPDGTPVHVTVSPAGGEEDLPEETSAVANELPLSPTTEAPAVAVAKPARGRGVERGVLDARTASWVAWLLFGLGLLVYVGTRLWGIDRFPIFFFTDEATFPLLAEQLLKQGLRDGSGSLFPLYFEVAGNRWTPVLAVYAHLPVVALFGKSILATRITAALVTVLTPIAISFIFKSVFRLRYWWVGTLLVAVVPTWFLHSRTGFEWLMMASFYAGFLLSYLLYRTRSPRFLWLAIVFGAATFYNHASGQLVMAAVALLLLISDFPYHLRQWRVVLVGIVLALILAIPFLRLQSQNPNALMTHLRTIDSYWFRDIPLADKLQQFASRYLYGLSPAYWFVPNQHDLIRHRMMGYGNLGFVLLPFVTIGLVRVLVNFRSASHRAVLLAAVAAPAGAATADVAITRMMAFVPPAVVLGGLGLDWFLGWLGGILRTRNVQASTARSGAGQGILLAIMTWAALAGASLWMLRDALTNGPTWYTEYGLYGMQFGARQLFAEAIPDVLAAEPDTTVMVSPNWANGADTFIRFFFPPAQQFTRVQMHDVGYFMVERRPLSSDMVFVMTPEEYAQAQASGKFSAISVSRTVPYPDGRIGFYFARLTYADDLDAILSREREERSRPVVEGLELDGQLVEVSHSRLDIGLLPNIFDGDTFTLVRGLEANPLVFEFTFPEPRSIQGIEMTFGSMDFTLTAQLTGSSGEPPITYSETFRGLPPDPTAGLTFDQGPVEVQKLRIEVLQLNAGVETHIHVRELQFK